MRFSMGQAVLFAAMGGLVQVFHGTGGTSAVVGGPVMLVLAVASAFLARPYPRVYEAATLLNYFVLHLILLTSSFFFENAETRYRLLGISQFAVKPLPIVFGMSELPYLVFLILSSVAEVVVNYLVTSVHGEKIALYGYINMFGIALVFALLERMMHLWLSEIYETERELAHVKSSHEALITTVCDSSFWLASDGDTIAQCDGGLESMVGTRAQGTRLSAHIPQTEEEQERLRAAFQRFPNDGFAAPVAPLTTTLCRAGSRVETRVDLMIVDRRAAAKDSGDAERSGGFLVGARVAREPLLEEVVVEHPPEAAAAPPPEEDAASDVVVNRVELPELEEVSVEFEVESDDLSIRRLCLTFAPKTPDLELPRFIDSLQERVPGRFRDWVQVQLNTAFAPPEAGLAGGVDAPEDLPNYGRVMFEMPAMGAGNGVMLAGEAAHLQMPEEFDPDPNDEPLTATLRVTRLWQVQFQRQMRPVPPTAVAVGPEPVRTLPLQL